MAHLGETHTALLNKFPITPGHLLLITREFEEQTTPLTEADFLALATAMQQVEGLMLFNGGRGAGASQRHKHLQLVPHQPVFIEPWLTLDRPPLQVVEQPQLLFRHAFTTLDAQLFDRPERAGAHLARACRALLEHLALSPSEGHMPPYNLLATRRWMMAVPRTLMLWGEGEGKIPINAISFSGSLLIYNPRLEAVVRQRGIRQILAEVTR